MNLRDLWLRFRGLVARHRVERELDDELSFHIERETQKQIAAGLSPEAARSAARARFGSVSLAADECRDARGTAGFDAVAQDVHYAFRTFRRAPLAALTIVATVAVGLGLVAVVFTVFSTFFLRPDAVRNPGELFAIERPPAPGSDAVFPFTIAEYDALRHEAGAYIEPFAMLRPVRARVDGRG
jgi:hypothetical protein